MIWFELTLRLIGELAYLETVRHAHADASFAMYPSDDGHSGRMTLPLARGDFGDVDAAGPEATQAARVDARAQFQAAAARLRALTPTLAAIDRERCAVDVLLHTRRTGSVGSFVYRLPDELIAAAGAAGLALDVSFS